MGQSLSRRSGCERRVAAWSERPIVEPHLPHFAVLQATGGGCGTTVWCQTCTECGGAMTVNGGVQARGNAALERLLADGISACMRSKP